MIKKFKVNRQTKCWEWFGELTGSGYGRINIDNKKKSAHRYFYEKFKGAIPKELQLDHLCRNRKCVNPEHLEAVTAGENVRRAWKERLKKLTNCPHGHPFSGKNLYIYFYKKQNKRWRVCKKCRTNNMFKLNQKKREQKSKVKHLL